jgi:hypothetical protein
MSMYPKFRDFHLYVGLALMVPVMIISATGIGLNHEKALGLKKELPKPKKEKREHYKQPKANEPDAADVAMIHPVSLGKEKPLAERLTTRSSLLSDNATAIDGALAAARETWGDVPLDHVQLKDEPGYGLVVKVKVPEHSNLVPEEIIYSVAAKEVVMRRGEKGEGYPLHKIIHDLHTGKIFSKDYGVLWSDISAGSILMLSMTGLVLYLIPIWKKRNKPKKSTAGKPDAAAILAAARAKKPVSSTETV